MYRRYLDALAQISPSMNVVGLDVIALVALAADIESHLLL